MTQNTSDVYVRLEMNPKNDLNINLDSSNPTDVETMKSYADQLMNAKLHKKHGTEYDDKIESFFKDKHTFKKHLDKLI